MLNKRCITSPAVYCCSFASEVVFWAILKISGSLFTAPPREGQRWKLIFERLQRQGDFPPKNRIAPLSNFEGEWPKDSRFFSYSSIENPAKRPGAIANPRRRSKSHTFRAVEIRNKINQIEAISRKVWGTYLSIYRYRKSKRWIQYIYYKITNGYINRFCGLPVTIQSTRRSFAWCWRRLRKTCYERAQFKPYAPFVILQ